MNLNEIIIWGLIGIWAIAFVTILLGGFIKGVLHFEYLKKIGSSKVGGYKEFGEIFHLLKWNGNLQFLLMLPFFNRQFDKEKNIEAQKLGRKTLRIRTILLISYSLFVLVLVILIIFPAGK